MNWRKRALALALAGSLCLGLLGCVPRDEGPSDAEGTRLPGPTQVQTGIPSGPEGTPTPVDPETTQPPAGTEAVLIAPARTREEIAPQYDTAAPSSVYVPDFGAATGYLLYGKKEGYDYRRYDRTDDVTWDQQLELIGAYMDALDELPNFQVLQPLSQNKTYKSYYQGALVYTGTGWVNDSVYDEYDGAHIFIKCNREWDHVMVYYDVGLEPVDTGLRLPGAGDLSDQLAVGPRLIDAYYESGGVYYNSSDRQLSAKAGECDILINGTDRYTGSVSFQLNTGYSTDELAITGLPRGDALTLSFPHDYPMTGDVYTIQDFRRTTSFGYWRSLTDGNQTGIRLIHDGQFYYPEACQDSPVTAATARILQWDKLGDTVIYFYLEATVDGQPCQIEALAAARWTEAETKPSGSSSGSKDCLTCGGSGNCHTCGGSGRVRNSMAGTGKWIEQDCTACGGSGDCRDCGGDGRR